MKSEEIDALVTKWARDNDVRLTATAHMDLQTKIGQALRKNMFDAACWRSLLATSTDAHQYQIGFANLVERGSVSLHIEETPVNSYVSIQHIPVHQVVFRWFGDGTFQDALIALRKETKA